MLFFIIHNKKSKKYVRRKNIYVNAASVHKEIQSQSSLSWNYNTQAIDSKLYIKFFYSDFHMIVVLI